MFKTKVVHALRLMLSVLPVVSAGSAANAAMHTPTTPWDIAQREDCAQAYTRFVLENPESPHVVEALCRLETLDTLASNVTARVAPTITPEMRSFNGAARLMNI